MSKLLSIIVILLDAVLLCLSAAILFTVVGMSVMIFDVGETTQGWMMFGAIAAICLGLMVAALYCGFKYYKKQRYLLSVLGSAIPLIAFAILQIAIGEVS